MKKSAEIGMAEWQPEEEISPSPLARRLVDILPNRSGNQILELGAREADLEGRHIGDDCIYLAKENNHITLVETGESILQRIQGKANAAGVEEGRIEFVLAQFDKLPLPDNQFDACFSMAGLDATYLPWSLKEACRILKPGGRGLFFIYYKMNGRLMQGPKDVLIKYIQNSGLNIKSEEVKQIDSEKGLEAIIFEVNK